MSIQSSITRQDYTTQERTKEEQSSFSLQKWLYAWPPFSTTLAPPAIEVYLWVKRPTTESPSEPTRKRPPPNSARRLCGGPISSTYYLPTSLIESLLNLGFNKKKIPLHTLQTTIPKLEKKIVCIHFNVMCSILECIGLVLRCMFF